MQLFGHKNRSSRSIFRFAGYLALLLAIAGVGFSAAPALAVYEAERPGVSSPNSGGYEASWKPSSVHPLIAQRLTQPTTGALKDMRLRVNSSVPYDFSGAALHTLSSGPEWVGAHVADAQISYESDAAGTWAVLDFPSRPMLQEHTEYALVIDSRLISNPSDTVSFQTYNLFSDNAPFSEMYYSAGAWKFQAWGSIILDSTLVDLFAETDAPVLEANTVCGVLPAVVIPQSEGVNYESSYDTALGAWQVTATILPGYLDDGNQVTSWSVPAQITPCASEPVVTSNRDELAATGSSNEATAVVVGVALMLCASAALLIARRGARA